MRKSEKDRNRNQYRVTAFDADMEMRQQLRYLWLEEAEQAEALLLTFDRIDLVQITLEA